MVLRIVSALVMGIAGLFGLEALGVVPQGKYFPTLPRLDREANTPANWLSAGNWGLSAASCLTQGESVATCTDSAATAPAKIAKIPKPSAKVEIVWDDVDKAVDEGLEGSAANDTPPASFTTRVAHKG